MDGGTVSVELRGADLELLRAGEAQGWATGARYAVNAVRDALRAWRAATVTAVDPAHHEEVDAFVASFETRLAQVESEANARDAERHAILGRALALGAGRPRARKLRERVRSAIVGARDGWRR